AVVGEEAGKQALFAVQGHVVEDQGFHQQVDVVGGEAGGGLHVATGAHIADLLVDGLLLRRAADNLRAAVGVVHQEIGGGGLLAVAGPYALAAPAGGFVQHAVGEYRAVAEHIDHHRHTDARGVFQAGADTATGAQVAGLAGGALAGVVVVTAHGDGTGAG